MTDEDSAVWRWLARNVVFAIHDRQFAEHGGPDGVRDPRTIKSALARPCNLAAYAPPDTADLAAAYAFGFARNHGAVDGNKRTAWIAARLFLANNGHRLEFEPMDAVRNTDGVEGG